MKLSDKMYDFLKECVLSYLPEFGLLIIGLDSIWDLGIPADQINRTIILVCSFLGVVLKVANVTYLTTGNEELPTDNNG